ncbi:hypothetical protein [Actinomadura sp. HBU206391]|uniref:hypothetical protein n=1 Tax=Actinomadura sp. HBU206391 TaxID=2731692 RepID=UPI00165072F9|nr:hypothetical protein [Actinomadura sp. HBU206391]MBC6456418.1 hypothetical protein [Actinomadura sp. HBU206391]
MDEILRRIEQTYGSLSDPKFFFVRRALEERPYDALVESIAKNFKVTEDTDENDDLAFNYLVSSDNRTWAMSISMVGPYALLARVGQAWDEILTPSTDDLSDHERWLLSRLTDSGLRPLGREELETPVALKLTGPDDVRVYHALFTDTDGLPWDKETLRRLGLID